MGAVDPDRPLSYKDAIFLSPHKFIGGPSTPGRAGRAARAVRQPGAGRARAAGPSPTSTTTTTATSTTRPTARRAARPAIIESVRAGLVFQLKQAVGTDDDPRAGGAAPRAGGRRLARRARRSSCSATSTRERLSIVSFVVRSPSGRYLHHNYVVALLNDLFGIQSRGGCSCAGPYGHRLLGIDLERSHEFEREITGGCEGIKPGWVRVNFNYFVSDAVADYLVEAVRLVARDGWRLLGDYRFDTVTGLWRHRDGVVTPPLSLHDVSYAGGRVVDAHQPRDRGRGPARRAPARRRRDPGRRRRARTWRGTPAASARTSSTCAGSTCRSAPSTDPGPTLTRPYTGGSVNYGRVSASADHDGAGEHGPGDPAGPLVAQPHRHRPRGQPAERRRRRPVVQGQLREDPAVGGDHDGAGDEVGARCPDGEGDVEPAAGRPGGLERASSACVLTRSVGALAWTRFV